MPGYANPYNINPKANNDFGDLYRKLLTGDNGNPDEIGLGALGENSSGDTFDQGKGFQAWLSAWQKFAGGNQNNFSRWLNSQQGKIQGLYDMADADPTRTEPLSWLDYLSNYNPIEDWNRASPYERGESPQTFAAKARWMR
jgi:hypothetical protein